MVVVFQYPTREQPWWNVVCFCSNHLRRYCINQHIGNRLNIAFGCVSSSTVLFVFFEIRLCQYQLIHHHFWKTYLHMCYDSTTLYCKSKKSSFCSECGCTFFFQKNVRMKLDLPALIFYISLTWRSRIWLQTRDTGQVMFDPVNKAVFLIVFPECCRVDNQIWLL